MSLLRIGGIAVGLAIIFYVMIRTRTGGLHRKLGLGLVVGFAFLVVSVDPTVVDFLAAALQLQDQSLGRLVALLVASSTALWVGLLHERSKREAFMFRMMRYLDGSAVQSFYARVGGMQSAPIAVLIPAYNEAESLPRVLKEIQPVISGESVQAFVIDDGSADGTSDVARRAGATVVSLPGNRGGGAALRIGYRMAASAGARVIVTLDADGQHDPMDMACLVEPILRGEADFVIGSRVLGRWIQSTCLRRVVVSVFSRAVSVLTGVQVTDCSSGYRAFSTAVIPVLELVEDQFHTTETIIRLLRSGIRFKEVPVTMRNRIAGKSKKGPDGRYGLNFARVILKSWLRSSN